MPKKFGTIVINDDVVAEDSHLCIAIRYSKSTDLPMDVFLWTEQPKKRKKAVEKSQVAVAVLSISYIEPATSTTNLNREERKEHMICSLFYTVICSLVS
jgi:hypothetical protein